MSDYILFGLFTLILLCIALIDNLLADEEDD